VPPRGRARRRMVQEKVADLFLDEGAHAR
jgi:hypothetical protein